MVPPGWRPVAKTLSCFGIHLVVSLEAGNPLGLEGKKTNLCNRIVMSKLAMMVWAVFSLLQTGTLSKINPHAKPF